MTKKFLTEEKYGITSQLNRSTLSIASNIAEGAGWASKKEFSQFLSIDPGSTFETETQTLLARRIGLLKEEESKPLLELAQEIERMLAALKNFLCNK